MAEKIIPATSVNAAADQGPVLLQRAFFFFVYLFLASNFFSIAVNSLALGMIAVLWLATMLVKRRFMVASTPLDYFFLAYLIAELVASVFSYNPAQSFLFSKRLLLIGVVYLFASVLSSKRIAMQSVAVLLGSACTVGILGVAKLVFADPESTTRLGIFQFYMTTSELMMMTALLLIPFIIHRNTPRKVRLAALLGLIPVLISLYATVTRGAYLAAAAGVLFIALVKQKKLILPLLAVIILLMVFAPPFVESRLHSIVDLQHPENASRMLLWGTGLRIFADHPFVGVGDIDLYELLVQYAPTGTAIEWGHLHNVLLQLLVTLGTLGFVVVVLLFVKIFITEWRILRQVKDDWFAGSVALGALAVFVGFQVNGLTEWSFGDQEVVLLFWTSIGLAVGVGRLFSQDASLSGTPNQGA